MWLDASVLAALAVQPVDATTAERAAKAPLGSSHSHDTGRNRDERRTVTVFDPTDKLADTDWHPHVTAIIQVERHVYTRNAKTGLLRCSAETAFYISNTPITAARAAEAIRAHWTIKSTSHCTRDVTLGEDRSRIRTNPGVFAHLRSFASKSSGPTSPTRSARTAIAPVSQASTTCSH